MAHDIEQKIRSLEALALRPGTPEEGEIARARAIELATKYNFPSIFTQADYKPPSPPVSKPTTAPPKNKLHRTVVAMEDRLKQDGWIYQTFSSNGRIYRNPTRPNEEIYMTAHYFGAFSCMHVFKPSNSTRPAGNDAEELDHFFNSMTYRFELWPRPQTRRPTFTDFYDPLLDEFDPMFGQPEPQNVQEQAKAPEPPPAPTTPPEPPEPQEEPVDVIDEMLRHSLQEEKEIMALLAQRLI
jgi:hypothetical protein